MPKEFQSRSDSELHELFCVNEEQSEPNPRMEALEAMLPSICKEMGKKGMTQFVKSVRIMMDASHDFKFATTTLRVIFHSQKGFQDGIDHNFRSCLLQEASEVVFIDGMDVMYDFYVKGDVGTNEYKTNLFQSIISHLYIARYYPSNKINIYECQLTDFSENAIEEILEADYPENNWETYLFILLGIVFLFVVSLLLYFNNVSFSSFVNNHTESVLLVVIVITLEMGILLLTIFENMCKLDQFSVVDNHPFMIFSLPILVVLIAPFLHKIIKSRKMP